MSNLKVYINPYKEKFRGHHFRLQPLARERVKMRACLGGSDCWRHWLSLDHVAILVQLLLFLLLFLVLVCLQEGLPRHLVDAQHGLGGVLQHQILTVIPRHDQVDHVPHNAEHIVASEPDLFRKAVDGISLNTKDAVRPRIACLLSRHVADLHGFAAGKNGLCSPAAQLEGVVLQLGGQAGSSLRLQVQPPVVGRLWIELVQSLHRDQVLL
mmetsp:Transcript_15019/g.23906  ORF Transcript_15019/g.23906 Transcript_15019/m.23906 type:complete len:211 (+) Transcript_15019:3-635(+)